MATGWRLLFAAFALMTAFYFAHLGRRERDWRVLAVDWFCCGACAAIVIFSVLVALTWTR